MYNNIVNALDDRFKPKPVPGKLGYEVNGELIIFHPDDSSLWACRFNGSWNYVRHRGNCLAIPHLDVYLEKEEDDVYAIQKVDQNRAKQYVGKENIGHIERGYISRSRQTLADPVDLRLISQLQLEVVSGLEIKIKPGFFSWKGNLYAWEDTDTEDLTSLVPSGTLTHAWAVVGFDPTSITDLISAVGTAQPVITPLTLADLAIVANDEFLANDFIPLCGVQLRHNQTQLIENDFEAIGFVGVQVSAGGAANDALFLAYTGL